jgi:hypothetical protein
LFLRPPQIASQVAAARTIGKSVGKDAGAKVDACLAVGSMLLARFAAPLGAR